MNLDYFLFQLINNLAGKWVWLDALGIFFAQYFEFVLIFFLLLFLVKNFKKYLPLVFKSLGAAILARLVIAEFIRWLWFRSRPFIENDVYLLINHSNTPAFPSGHASFYFAISTVVYYYHKKIGILFYLASFLICFSRVFGGIHWPFDILTGALVGIFSGWLIMKIFKK
jgi:undecaprenyl-diphosphatase